MNRTILGLMSCGLLLATCASSPVCAQTSPKAPAEEAPKAQPSPAKAQTMWDFQKELGLSDDQVKTMKGTVAELAKYLDECRTRIASNEKETQTLIADNADIAKIRPYLKSTADIQVEMRVADIKASQKLNATLSPAQLTKWHKIQAHAKAQSAQPTKEQEPPATGEQ